VLWPVRDFSPAHDEIVEFDKMIGTIKDSLWTKEA